MRNTLDSKTIEELGVGEVRKYFNYSTTISPEIPIGDKGPVWDGSLILYSANSKNKNSSLIGKIPTQVKATCNATIPHSTANFKVKVNDVNIYQKNLGVAYFLVYINPKTQETKIFYSLLAPVDLKRYLTIADGRKTISIELKALPTLSWEIENQFLDFYNDCKRQANYSKPIFLKDIENDDIDNLTIYFTHNCKNRLELLKYITTNKHFIYATFKGDPTKTPHPLGDSRYELKGHEEIDFSISVGNKTYYDRCIFEVVNGETFIVVKDVLRFPLPLDLDEKPFSGKIDIKTSFQTLSQKIQTLEFLNDIIKHQSFSAGGLSMNVSGIAKSDMVNIQNDLKGAVNLKKVLDILHVSEELDICNLTDNEIRNINFLINYFLFHKENMMPNIVPPQLVKMDISNVSILFFVDEKEDDKKLRVSSAYDLNSFVFYTEDDKKQIVIVPPYAGYGKVAFRDVSNINYSDILPSFIKAQSDANRFYQAMNWTILKMIMGYDEQEVKNKILLGTALELAEWLEANDPDVSSHDIHTINRLQIIKRLRELNVEEENLLLSILDKDGSGDEMKFAANLLLDNFKMAKRYFDRLDETTKQHYIKELPLYNLIKEQI